jgi:aminopeptidase 2
MLNAYLGPVVFAKGVSNYLKKHAYGNARTVDLWQALSEVSGNNITEMMYSWTREVGYPVISIIGESYDTEKKELTLELTQQRFLGAGDVKPEEDRVSWFIPIPVLTNVGDVTVCLMTGKTGTITFPYTSGEDSFYKLNAGVTGFYRVNYSDAYLSKLAKALLNNGERFSTSDRIGISSDAFSMASSGLGSTVGALEVVKGYENEENQMYLIVNLGSYKNLILV